MNRGQGNCRCLLRLSTLWAMIVPPRDYAKVGRSMAFAGRVGRVGRVALQLADETHPVMCNLKEVPSAVVCVMCIRGLLYNSPQHKMAAI